MGKQKKCKTCLAWVKGHQDSAYRFCYFGPRAVERRRDDWCLQWQERGDRDPREVDAPTAHRIRQPSNKELQDWLSRDLKQQDPASLVCPDCHGPIQDIGQEGSLTVWQCCECERVTTAPLDASGELCLEFCLESKPSNGKVIHARVVERDACPCSTGADIVMCRNCEDKGGWQSPKTRAGSPEPRMISTDVYAIYDDGIAKSYLFATRDLAKAWQEREKDREWLEGCTIERYTLWHEVPPPECSWCEATGDLASVVWKSEDLLLCKACLAKCTGKAASDE